MSLVIILFISACSSSQEATGNEENSKEEIYVFDDAGTELPQTTDSVDTDESVEDTVNFIREAEAADTTVLVDSNTASLEQTAEQYIVQVGAFSTKDKADTFVKENQKEITFPMEVKYSSKVNLFVVWLPKFNSRDEAENVRNTLWNNVKFKDAFIITLE